MMTERCMTQAELAERWRTEACGPVFLKLGVGAHIHRTRCGE